MLLKLILGQHPRLVNAVLQLGSLKWFVSFIGNKAIKNVAVGNMLEKSEAVPPPIVGTVHLSSTVSDECGQKFPAVFPACTVTRVIRANCLQQSDTGSVESDLTTSVIFCAAEKGDCKVQ